MSTETSFPTREDLIELLDRYGNDRRASIALGLHEHYLNRIRKGRIKAFKKLYYYAMLGLLQSAKKD